MVRVCLSMTNIQAINNIFLIRDNRIRFVTNQFQHILITASKWQCLDPSLFCVMQLEKIKNDPKKGIRSSFY